MTGKAWDAINKRMEQAGITTLQELSKLSGVSYFTLDSIRRSRRDAIFKSTAERLAKVFDCAPDELRIHTHMTGFKPTSQPCWTCQHAVPDPDKRRGCSWSRRLEPVRGWEAIRTREGGYTILECPRYKPDEEETE